MWWPVSYTANFLINILFFPFFPLVTKIEPPRMLVLSIWFYALDWTCRYRSGMAEPCSVPLSFLLSRVEWGWAHHFPLFSLASSPVSFPENWGGVFPEDPGAFLDHVSPMKALWYPMSATQTRTWWCWKIPLHTVKVCRVVCFQGEPHYHHQFTPRSEQQCCNRKCFYSSLESTSFSLRNCLNQWGQPGVRLTWPHSGPGKLWV
jgi:hypothetical protein